MKIFKDRQSAGKLLAQHLKRYKGQDNVLVLGIPRGGVVVAVQIARKLNLPLDIVITRKIGAPTQSELALGAVDPDGEVVWDKELISAVRVNVEQLKDEVEKQIAEIKRREEVYRQRKLQLDVEDKTVILVDDGIATGSTTLAAINYLKRQRAKKIILAVPVASREVVDRVSREIEKIGEVMVLETPENFQAVGQFYQQFEEVSDEEVVQLLS